MGNNASSLCQRRKNCTQTEDRLTQESINLRAKLEKESTNSFDDDRLSTQSDIYEVIKQEISDLQPSMYSEVLGDLRYTSNKNTEQLAEKQNSSANAQVLAKKSKRLQNEIKVLSKHLPVTQDNSIFVVSDVQDSNHFNAIITGSAKTPYAYGCFLFDMYCNDSFPASPPSMKLITTGGNKIRFNPNLYNCGYVCLSILGTWGNTWTETQSNIYQILISIQSLVMVDEILFQEPGYDNQENRKNKEFINQNLGYQQIVKYGNIKWAMNEQLANPPPQFKEQIQTHFYLNKQRIIEEIDGWVQFTKDNSSTIDYAGRSQNYNLSQEIGGSKYLQMFQKEYDILKGHLENLKYPVISSLPTIKQFIEKAQEKSQEEQDKIFVLRKLEKKEYKYFPKTILVTESLPILKQQKNQKLQKRRNKRNRKMVF